MAKYRAKCKSWKVLSQEQWWVYGVPTEIEGKSVMLCESDRNLLRVHREGDTWSANVYVVEIDATTLCRCTEKEYMDSEMAYEGDIFESQTCGLLMVIRYGTFQAYCPVDGVFMDSVGFYASCDGFPDMPIGDLKDYALKKGNIFDDISLLSKEV